MALTQAQIDSIADGALSAFNDLEAALRGEAAAELGRGEAADRAALKTRLAMISRRSKRDIEIVIRDTLQASAEASLLADEKTYAAARVAGLVAPYADAAESELLNRILSDGIATAQSMANLVRTSAEQAVYSDFIDALDSSLLATVTPDGVGVEAATRSAMKRVITSTTTVTYAQADGSVIEQSFYGAVRRAVAASSNQVTARMTLARAEELGVGKFEVSAHLGARPDHAEWQGGVYTMAELVEVCGYGDGDGLCGWGCRHTFYPFFEGLSEPGDWAFADDPTGEEYALSQRQRACERNIREYKGRENAYRAIEKGADPELSRWAKEEKIKAANLKRKWQGEADSVASQRGGGGARRPAREVATPK